MNNCTVYYASEQYNSGSKLKRIYYCIIQGEHILFINSLFAAYPFTNI